ncbi:hypothetical protein M23134_03941 [Microscilla marina ATCC 23134]|uniref:Uncharacterized protein n=1 Tax=Microscilla marina ATCC 23134 TaxID=313606 RepID=A1ZMK9_MICM2|nr:hypothetical protein M23134_03941 [Microscilla marina ATCC 23134]
MLEAIFRVVFCARKSATILRVSGNYAGNSAIGQVQDSGMQGNVEKSR